MRINSQRLRTTDPEIMRQQWWDWTLAITFLYFLGLIIFSFLRRSYDDALLCSATTLPPLAAMIGLYHRTLPLSFKSLFLVVLSFGGVMLRFYLFKDDWYRQYWFFTAIASWILYGVLAFEGSARYSPSLTRSFVTLACPLLPSFLLWYYIFP